MPSTVSLTALSTPPHAHPTTTAILLSFLLSSQRIHSQTWETSNDPDHLCTTTSGVKFTGYKATKDCRGYVYCSDGYLMGGGVIPCWPNQLFDEVAATCSSWQSVDTSQCPDFDGSMMMPDQQDENANPERFFVSNQVWFLSFRPTFISISVSHDYSVRFPTRIILCAASSVEWAHQTLNEYANPVPVDRG